MQTNQRKVMEINHIVLGKTLIIGFFGGLLLMSFFAVIHYFNMIEIDMFKPWKVLFKKIQWSTKWYMYPLWIICYGVVSMLPAIVYFIIGKKRNNWDAGALYGFSLAVIGYIFLPNLLLDYHVLQLYEWKTHLSIFVLFIIYGMFIGYSISYEYGYQLETHQNN